MNSIQAGPLFEFLGGKNSNNAYRQGYTICEVDEHAYTMFRNANNHKTNNYHFGASPYLNSTPPKIQIRALLLKNPYLNFWGAKIQISRNLEVSYI